MTFLPHRNRWQVFAIILRFIALVGSHWFLLIVAVCIVAPITPHILWEYDYEMRGNTRRMMKCHYYGSRGKQIIYRPAECQLIAFLDLRIHSPK